MQYYHMKIYKTLPHLFCLAMALMLLSNSGICQYKSFELNKAGDTITG